MKVALAIAFLFFLIYGIMNRVSIIDYWKTYFY